MSSIVSRTVSWRMKSRRCSNTTLRWSFMTSSYFRMFLRMSKLRASTLLLRLLERLVDPGMDDRLVLLEAELRQHAVHAVGPEDAHQVVLQRQEELRAAGIALAAGAAAQLVVDAAALMALGADDVEPAGLQQRAA